MMPQVGSKISQDAVDNNRATKSAPLRILYITYLGLLEPIPQSQVIPYLALMAKDAEIHLLSFEKNIFVKKSPEKLEQLKKRLNDVGIIWHRLRYHKRPHVLSSIYDIAIGFIVSFFLIIRYRLSILHARSNVPIAIGFLIKKLTGVKVLYDRRGVMGEDQLEISGWKKGGWLYRFAIWFDKLVIKNSEAVVVLTNKMNKHLKDNLFDSMNSKPLIVTIPCCVGEEFFRNNNDRVNLLKEKLNLSGRFIFVYSGSIATYNLLDEMLDFFKTALLIIPNSHFLILSHTPDAIISAVDAKRLDKKDITITFSERESIMDFLSLGDVGLIFRRNSLTALAASPTKFAEYLACGLPVVSTPRIGDLDEIINNRKIGVVLEEHAEHKYKEALNKLQGLLKEKDALSMRCRRTAEDIFSLQRGSSSYLNIYNHLTGQQRS